MLDNIVASAESSTNGGVVLILKSCMTDAVTVRLMLNNWQDNSTGEQHGWV